MHRAPRFWGDYGVASPSADVDSDIIYTMNFDEQFDSICDDWSLDDNEELDIDLLR